jgi:hypothetical protein
MNPTNPWFRFVAGMVSAAVAIRLTVESLLPNLAGAALIVFGLWCRRARFDTEQASRFWCRRQRHRRVGTGNLGSADE